jgi:hypothetical protein
MSARSAIASVLREFRASQNAGERCASVGTGKRAAVGASVSASTLGAASQRRSFGKCAWSAVARLVGVGTGEGRRQNRRLPHRRRECLRRAALHPSQDSGRPAAERAPFWEESEAVEPIVLVDNAALHFAMLPVDAERFHPRAIGGGTKKGKVRTVGARSVCGPFS